MAVAALLGLATLVLTVAASAPTPAGAVTDLTPTIVVANADNPLLAFPLSATGNATPSATVTPPSLHSPYQETFDASGNLWVTSASSAAIEKFTPSQQVTGSPTPAVTLTPTGVSGLEGVVFDPSGDLWVIGNANNTIAELTPSQIATTGSPTPVVVVHYAAGPIFGAFDASGDLWVTNYGSSTVAEFTPAQLAAGGSPTPAVIISSNGSHSLNEPWGIAFDSAGDLWVTNFGQATLVEFTPAQLATNGSPTPTVTVSGGSLDGSTGIAFDANHNLWATNFNSSLVEFSQSQLASSGSPTPVDTISGGATGLGPDTAVAIAQAPTVSSVTPTTGPVAGGTTVTIHGSMFLPGSQVAFGSTPATSVTYVSPYVMTAVAPAGAGTVDVTVTDFAGTSTTSAADQYTYPTAPATGNKYREVAKDGGIFSFGNALFYGSQGGAHLNAPIVGMAPTSDNLGYWEVASDGGIFAFGDAAYYGSEGGQHLNAPIVGMASTPDGKGYWLVASDGGIFTNGDALYSGSEGGTHLNQPVVGMGS
jgi:sugar lactone lactonase YvrE